jgi:hypothetical protein
MKNLFTLSFLLGLFSVTFSQQLPNLPIPIGAGNAEVWNGAIYNFGGSNNWSGSIVYPRIYKFDGTGWVYHDSIPDYNLWDVETIRVGDNVYLIGGWPNGQSLNRRYNLVTGDWVYLSESPNLSQDWGLTSEELDGIIYLFNSSGEVFAYNIASDTWSTKSPNPATGTWDMSSILYHNQIYIIGWSDSAFYKYNPSSDIWTQLANSPYPVGACAFGIINNLIYGVGGNIGGLHGASYKSIIVYNITTDSWTIDNQEISSKRHWMSTAEYNGGLYVVGGIDSIAQAVDIVEEIVPQGTAGVEDFPALPDGYYLGQNSPNPCLSNTIITYTIPETSFVNVKVYDVLGNEIAKLVDEQKNTGTYNVSFNAKGLQRGVYCYTLKSGNFIQLKKLIVQ